MIYCVTLTQNVHTMLSPMALAQSDQWGGTLRWSSSSVCSRCWCGPRRPCCRCCQSDGCKRAQRPWKDDSASSCTPAGSSLGREHLAWRKQRVCIMKNGDEMQATSFQASSYVTTWDIFYSKAAPGIECNGMSNYSRIIDLLSHSCNTFTQCTCMHEQLPAQTHVATDLSWKDLVMSHRQVIIELFCRKKKEEEKS